MCSSIAILFLLILLLVVIFPDRKEFLDPAGTREPVDSDPENKSDSGGQVPDSKLPESKSSGSDQDNMNSAHDTFPDSPSDPGHINQMPESEFMKTLVYDNSCEDNYIDCKIWAKNGECEINPEYMLYQCAKSCSACKFTGEQKLRLDQIYNSKPPKNCVYHGADYPSEFGYLNKLYDYTLSVGY